MERNVVKPIVSRKHIWRKDENGEIDMSAYSVGYCNGPCCTICGSSFCEFCTPDYDDTLCKPHYICPECGTALSEEHEEKYCKECGVKFDWKESLPQSEIELKYKIEDACLRITNRFTDTNANVIVKLIKNEPKSEQVRLFNLAYQILKKQPNININSIYDLKHAALKLDLF